MRKQLRFLMMAVFALAFSLTAQAQYYYIPYSGGNPGGLNTDAEYPPGSGLPAGWAVIQSGSATIVNAPVWSPVQTLPFAFSLNGTAVTNYKVSTSGVLTFTTTATTVPSATNVALPSADIPDNSVMIWGLYANAGDQIITKTFGTAPNRQHWIQFNSYSQTTSTTAGYTYWSIVLEETTNKIHFVDQRSAGANMTLTAGIQINSTTAYQVAASPNLNSATLSTADPTPADNNYYTFTPGTQPAYDMSVLSVNNPTYLVLANAPFNITGTIKNYGTAPVTSFTLNYSINGGAPVSAPVTANIATLGSYIFSHSTPWTPSATGVYTIAAWATNINGNPDMITSNDVGSKQVNVVANTAIRTVLHEVFTSSTCGPCKPGNENLRNITQANPGKAIDIKYQQDFPAPGNDPYQTPESISRRGYYGINSIPRMEVDGGWDGNANSYTTGLLNNARSKPALIAVSGTHTLVGTTITGTAVIDPIGNNISSQNLVVHTVITERRTFNNVRTNGETVFFDVMKKMLPNQNGLAIPPLTAGNTQSIPFTYTFPAGNNVEHFDSLRVVIFVQDAVTKEVFQAAHSVRTNSPTGLAEASLAAAVAVYPNPSEGRNINLDVNLATAETVQVKVVNTLGQVVYAADKGKMAAGLNTLPLDLNGQAKGIYFVNVTIGGKTVTKKLSLTL